MLSSEKDVAALAEEVVGWRRLLARVEPAPGVRGQARAARMSEKQHTEGTGWSI